MDNTARLLVSPQPAYELFYRMIDGEPVTGSEILATLGADIEKGYLVGAQSILTLVRDNPAVDDGAIQVLTTMLESGAARLAARDPETASAYKCALRECHTEISRRAGRRGEDNVIQLRS